MTPGTDVRVALYYAPAEADPLWQAGCAWLGRDAATGVIPTQPVLAGIRAITAAPAAYGFHATLKAPFRLRAGVTMPQLLDRAATVCRRQTTFLLPRLVPDAPGGLLLLRERIPCVRLRGFADTVVEAFDDLRAPLNTPELDRRRGSGLTTTQEAMLQRWGYVSVFGLWRFHMTLGSWAAPSSCALLLQAARAHFGPALAFDRVVDELCIFLQPEPHLPFRVAARIPLG